MIVLQGVKRAVESLAFHPDGENLVFAGGYDDTVEYWSATTGIKLHEWTGPHGAREVRFHPSGRLLLCSYATSSPRSDEDFIALDTETWDSVAITSPDTPTHIAIAPTGDRLVIHNFGYHARLLGRTITAKGVGRRLWAKNLYTRDRTTEWIVGGLDFFPDGDRFASVEFQRRDDTHSRSDAVLRIRSAATGGIDDQIPCPCEVGFDARVSPDGEWVAFHALTELLFVPTGDPKAVVKLRNPNRKHLTSIAFHPSGRFLATTSNDKTVRLHDRDADWAVTRTFDWKIGALKSVAFSPDGNLAAAGGEKGQIVVWDVDV
jgi:WD40 repeat protein